MKEFKDHRIVADAMDNLISLRIETELELKLQDLLKQLIDAEDDSSINTINQKIANTHKDIKDLLYARELRIKRSRE